MTHSALCLFADTLCLMPASAGIEWVDRSKRTHHGNVLHPLGAGVDLDGRDSVAVPYAPGYNAFATPVGYHFI